MSDCQQTIKHCIVLGMAVDVPALNLDNLDRDCTLPNSETDGSQGLR